MNLKNNDSRWKTIAGSIRGPAHKRNGLPNQDRYKCTVVQGENPLLVAFVSDGHGSKNYFRSHRGAAFAVEAATNIAIDFVKGSKSSKDLALIKQIFEEKLPRLIVNMWSDSVEKHLKINSISEGELDGLEAKNKDNVLEKPQIAYGATLLGVVISGNFIVYLQIGDGDIITISEDGEIGRPLPKDERFIANETVSLCTDQAWNEFSVIFKVIDEKTPALIMISTDGYSNSFRSEADFNKAALDYHLYLRDEGEDYVSNNLKKWLECTAAEGSGDDTTVVLIAKENFLE
jgi:serine/threonine protein phosphatase PrpC